MHFDQTRLGKGLWPQGRSAAWQRRPRGRVQGIQGRLGDPAGTRHAVKRNRQGGGVQEAAEAQIKELAAAGKQAQEEAAQRKRKADLVVEFAREKERERDRKEQREREQRQKE